MAAVIVTRHAEDRRDQRAFTDAEIADITGTGLARAWQLGRIPEPGHPVCIGVQAPGPGRDRRQVLVGVTAAGRRGIGVVARPRGGAAVIVTIFDPTEHSELWRDDATGPTAAGVRAMPPTIWYRPPPTCRPWPDGRCA